MSKEDRKGREAFLRGNSHGYRFVQIPMIQYGHERRKLQYFRRLFHILSCLTVSPPYNFALFLLLQAFTKFFIVELYVSTCVYHAPICVPC